MSEENTLINPKDLQKREPRQKEESSEKYRVKGNLVEVKFESNGRFSLPSIVYFEDYNVEDIQEFAVCSLDDILETVVVILDKLKNKDCEVSITKATPNEFIEILIGMKAKFDIPEYKHSWICSCQYSKSEDDQIVNENTIHLNKIKFKSIEEVDEDIRKNIKIVFDKMSEEEFNQYLKDKYKNDQTKIDTYNRELELESIQVNDNIQYRSKKDNKVYNFSMMKIENVLQAQKIVKEKYKHLIKSIHNKKNNGKPLDIFKSEKEEELNKIEKKKAKDIITYSEGLTLKSVDGVEIKDIEEKINIYKKLKRDDYFELENFIKTIDYGAYYDEKLSCPLCGKAEGRVLRQDINPIELLPLDPDSKSSSNKRDGGGLNIYFGV